MQSKTPGVHTPDVSVQLNIKKDVCGYKDSKNFFSNPIRQKIFELFLGGGKYSTVELSRIFNNPDPRSHIRFIRNAGVPISDYWVKTKFSKYKVYFLNDSV
jgi:hypothetical protein